MHRLFRFAPYFLAGFASAIWAQSPATIPNDETPGLPIEVKDPNVKDKGEEQDKPTKRLEWQVKAMGPASPLFRSVNVREGERHSGKKDSEGGGPRWVNIGPTGAEFEQNGSFTGHVRDSGRIRTILPHPTSQEIVYVLSSGGGLWRTRNWSSPNIKWTPLTDNLPTTGGGSVAFGKNAETLYLGLGDPYDQILVGGAIVKSTNGGESWGPIVELGSTVSVRDVKVDTRLQKDVVLVATDSGLYRSIDGGVTYTAVPTFAGLSVWSIVRTSAGWLASAQPCAPGATGLLCGGSTTLYLSADLGGTWAPITNAGGVFSGAGRTTLGVGLAGDSVVYAYSSTINEGQLRDVFRSADGGQTWVATNTNASKSPTNPNASQSGMNICGGQCWYNQSILVDPRDASRNTVWIGGNLAAARSTDGGGLWTLKTWWLYSEIPGLPYAHADHHAAVVKMTGTPSIILGNDGGLNVSEDNGATFSSDKNNGLTTHLFYTITGSAKLPSLVMGGLQDNGTRLRKGNGTIYNQVIGGDGLGAAISTENTNTMLGSAQGSSIRTSLHNAPPEVFQMWSPRGALSDSAGAGFQTAIIPAPYGLDSSGRVFFHFTNSRVWRTNDGGLNWIRIGSATTPLSTGLPATRRFRSSSYNLGVSPADLNRIALGAGGGFMDVTTDGGTTWTDINLVAAVPGYLGFVSSVIWQNNQTIWITSNAQGAGAARVIKASIATPAASWTTATYTVLQTGLPDLPVNRLYVDPRDVTGKTLYAATHAGIYRTLNGGTSWAPYGKGLPTVRVSDIYMPPDGGLIRVATYGRGIWELAPFELVSTVLSDDNKSCDRDGVLDNGEAGMLTFRIKNWGSDSLEDLRVKVTSSNPHVTFPSGNTLGFPGISGSQERFASLRVALNGAVGVESTDFTISISGRELGLDAPMTVVSSHRLNYNDVAASSTSDDFESNKSGWSVSGGTLNRPNIIPWQYRSLSQLNRIWWGPDSNGQGDDVRSDLPDQQILTSPVMKVGATPLSISFSHRFSFESGAWDGGVVELTTDNGASWTDIGGGAYNGITNPVTSAPIGSNRPAFVNRLANWPAFVPVTLNLGTAYAGKDVRIRFRSAADESTGAPGWELENISVTGLTNRPFGSLVAQTGVCTIGDRDDDKHSN